VFQGPGKKVGDFVKPWGVFGEYSTLTFESFQNMIVCLFFQKKIKETFSKNFQNVLL
jgi:hypothetical protein